MTEPDPTAVLFSASERYLGQATRALQRRLPDAGIEELAPEVGRISQPGLTLAEVAATCQDAPVPFVRHLAVEHEVVSLDELSLVAERTVGLARQHGGDRFSLQVWTSGKVLGPDHDASVAVRATDVRADIAAALTAAGVEVTRGGDPTVLSVCLTPHGASLGIADRDHMLADWPGGRVVLGRPPEQVSRAEWKLEEVFKLQGDILGPLGATQAAGGGAPKALDLGASPGGWTRILRRRGVEVWAVDPAELHPTVATDRGVHHVRTTAGRFLSDTDEVFDLVVNDMRMDAERSARVMVDAAARVRDDGLAVLTLKVAPHRSMVTVERSLALLAAAYTPVMVRQLYHNRNEVTVLARRS